MRKTLNPYRKGLWFIYDRLRWDMSIISWFSRSKLRSIKNNYVGQKAVILCNGPSLLDVNLDQLYNVYTFGLNKINLIFNSTKFRPSCIVSVNPFVLEQNKEFFISTNIPLFLDSKALSYKIRNRKNIVFLHSSEFPYFSRDCSISMFQGYTVTNVALQLAYHMGFSKVCLVGCDHNYAGNEQPNSVCEVEEVDRSHFIGNYFEEGQVWQFPDLENSEVYYKIAKNVYESDGRVIYNASTKTKLNVFPKIELEQFLAET